MTWLLQRIMMSKTPTACGQWEWLKARGLLWNGYQEEGLQSGDAGEPTWTLHVTSSQQGPMATRTFELINIKQQLSQTESWPDLRSDWSWEPSQQVNSPCSSLTLTSTSTSHSACPHIHQAAQQSQLNTNRTQPTPISGDISYANIVERGSQAKVLTKLSRFEIEKAKSIWIRHVRIYSHS